MTGQAGFQGHAPTVEVRRVDDGTNPEADKYRRLWDMPVYRDTSPGEHALPRILAQLPLTASSHVIDFGCGTGRAAAALMTHIGCRVTMLDFADNCLDPAVREAMAAHPDRLEFRVADLEQPIPVTAAFGICTDVMEHIPTERVPQVLSRILQAANRVWFQISLTPDHLGTLIDAPLHLTVQPYAWWMQTFASLDCTIHYASAGPNAMVVCASAWKPAADLAQYMKVNIEPDIKRQQIQHNITQGWQTVAPCQVMEDEVMLVGGGWSLPGQLETIRRLRAEGAKLVTFNNAYTWCLEHGLTPSATIVMDGREFNKRFVTPVVEGCKYLICSQVHPAVLEGLPHDRTYLWHDADPNMRECLDAQYGADQVYPVPGGSTAFLRAVPLLRMLGYHKFHVFGVDSCLAPDNPTRHHAYAQPENDHPLVVPVTVGGGRVFYCQPWMLSQAQEFYGLIASIGELVELEIYGDGLLRYQLESAAELTAPSVQPAIVH